MKKIYSLLIFILFISGLNSQTVKLKITYKDFPVQNSDITVKIGEVSLGKGRTDNDGEVSISCSNLISKSIDVYGSKTTSNATKTWDVKGFVNLDGSNFYHLKMEVCAAQMAEASGGFLSESAVASMWGLAASGSNESKNNEQTSSNSGSNSNTETKTNSKNEDEEDDEISITETATDMKKASDELKQMREDNLKVQEQNLQQEVIRYEKKIIKSEKEIQKANSEGKSQNYLRRLALEKQIDVLTLEKKNLQLKDVSAKVAKNELPFEQRKQNELRIDQIKSETDVLKEEVKKLKKLGDEPEIIIEKKTEEKTKVVKTEEKEIEVKNEEEVEVKTEMPVKPKLSEEEIRIRQEKIDDEDMRSKSKQMLKLDLTEYKISFKKKNLNFKIMASAGTQNEEKMTELKKDIVSLEIKIAKYEKRIEELEKEQEGK